MRVKGRSRRKWIDDVTDRLDVNMSQIRIYRTYKEDVMDVT